MDKELTVSLGRALRESARSDYFRQAALRIWPEVQWPKWVRVCSVSKDGEVIELPKGTYRIWANGNVLIEGYVKK